jgi:uncharacterized membrane protein HdeD (DUF308 family)
MDTSKRPRRLVILGIVVILAGVTFYLTGNHAIGAVIAVVGVPLIAAGRMAARKAAAASDSNGTPPASP